MVEKILMFASKYLAKKRAEELEKKYPKKVNKSVKLNKMEFEYLCDKADIITEGKDHYLKIKNSKSTRYWKPLFNLLIECDKSLGRTMEVYPNYDKNSIYLKVRGVHNALKQQRKRLELKKKNK